MTTLQINDSGSWRTLLKFEHARREDVLGAMARFASVLGSSTTFCLLHDDGHREWLRDMSHGPWQPVTAEQPPALEDVMVSAYAIGDTEPRTFMAWRTLAVYGPAKWMISGSDCEELRMEVYAFAPIIEPAPMPTQQVAA